MPRNECAAIRMETGLSRQNLATVGPERIAFLLPPAIPKTAERTPQARLAYLLLQLIQPLSCTDKLRHLRLVVLPAIITGAPVALVPEALHYFRRARYTLYV